MKVFRIKPSIKPFVMWSTVNYKILSWFIYIKPLEYSPFKLLYTQIICLGLVEFDLPAIVAVVRIQEPFEHSLYVIFSITSKTTLGLNMQFIKRHFIPPLKFRFNPFSSGSFSLLLPKTLVGPVVCVIKCFYKSWH